jgi:predicted ATPase
LLIGEQASGKSTIAKLIYFFQTLPDALYEGAVTTLQKGTARLDFYQEIHNIASRKFSETFGLFPQHDGFSIRFEYGNGHYLEIIQGQDRLPRAGFEIQFAGGIFDAIQEYWNADRVDKGTDEKNLRHTLRQQIDNLFFRSTTAHTYLIAGRSNVVAYPEYFERIVQTELEKLFEDEVREEEFEKRQRLGNERLLFQFVEWSKGIRNNFKNNGQTFTGVARSLENIPALRLIEQISGNILKGNYISSEAGEMIQTQIGRQNVQLKDASSGQQEVLRLLQGIFLAIGLRNRKEFFVVEEPEAHLYPLAQKELINAYAVFLNTIPAGRLIITTHSPYILACVNILLMASYVSEQSSNGRQETVETLVRGEFRLDSDFFSAYFLGGDTVYCQSIKDEETGMIDENYLDLISEQLGLQYQQLYEILA